MRGGLCPNLLWVDKVDPILSYGIVDGILHERATVRYTPQPFEIRLVFGEEKCLRIFAMQLVAAKRIMTRFDHRTCAFTQHWFASITAPAPGIAKPHRRQKMQRRPFRAAVGRCRTNQNIFWSSFGISHLDVEIAFLSQSIGVPELELGFGSRAIGVAAKERLVGNEDLGMTIETTQI